MRGFRVGLLAGALVATVGIPLAGGSARAQEPGLEASQNSTQDGTQASANSAQNCPGNPDAIGTSRMLVIDPRDYSHVGRMQYPTSLPLEDKEVVLTFDDGPLPPYSNQILDILAAQCVKATYFLVGEMARAYPATARRVFEAGHTIGTHSESHPMHIGRLPIDKMRMEIDRGIADVSQAIGDPRAVAPFFRIPGLDRSDTLESELAARSLIVFSSDTVADDWHHHITPGQIISLAIKRLEARGKGILLLHDIHPTTVAALPGLLKELKDNGFHIVQIVPAPSDHIVTAGDARTRMLASAVPDDLTIDVGAQPSWPEAGANRAPDEIDLPVPDASAFAPDAVPGADSSDVQWPNQPETKAAEDSTEPARHSRRTARHHREVAGSADHDSPRRRPHEHGHAGAGTEGNHADLASKVKSFAALFTPATPAH
jgi:peptidoglycan/xylan/chitin deacetylase (PgdA/CDA1 family)